MHFLKNCLSNLAANTGAAALGLRLRRSHPLILLYHGVSNAGLTSGLRNCEGKHVPQVDFVRHLKSLKRHRSVIPLKAMVEGLRSGDDLSNTVAITFDDGYENNFLRAAPALADFNMPAAFFLTTGFIGTDRCIWTDRVESILDRVAADSIFVGAMAKALPVSTLNEKRAALRTIKAALKQLPLNQALEAVTRMADSLNIPELPSDGDYRFMSWDQARQLHHAGFEIGAHTVNHPIMSKISLHEAEQEILESRDHIAAQLTGCSETFCYPNGKTGDYTPDIVSFVKQHFSSALATNRGHADVAELFELRRLSPAGGRMVSDIELMLLRER